MSKAAWEYYGRDGPNGIHELYRCPASSRTPSQRFATMQRLRKGLFWLDASDDPALNNEWASGWFSFEENRLTEEQAAALVLDWGSRDRWPGRP